jgi:hypothetical protein
MEKISIMVSSTVSDLESERDAVKKAFQDNPFVELLGAFPLNDTALAGNSRLVTKRMAKDCNLYILILGNRFGLELENGKSATEIEFDAAMKEDPTKVLVFIKEDGKKPDEKQRAFINRVSNYNSGYWRTSFRHTHDLQEYVKNSFSKWLKERAALGENLTYVDHFIRLSRHMKPEPHAEMYYKVTKDDVELEYKIFGKSHEIHFSKEEIHRNFWDTLNKLESQFSRWLD